MKRVERTLYQSLLLVFSAAEVYLSLEFFRRGETPSGVLVLIVAGLLLLFANSLREKR